MKKIVLFTVAFFICSLGFSIEAKVISVSGKAQVQKSGVWKNISVGDVLTKGNLIQTGFKSQVVFSIKSNNENSKITVNQLSRITIEQLMEDNSGDTTSVFVTTGSVKSEIKKTTDFRTNYTVRSPVATASVRGTDFVVFANGIIMSVPIFSTCVIYIVKAPAIIKSPNILNAGFNPFVFFRINFLKSSTKPTTPNPIVAINNGNMLLATEGSEFL